MAAWNEIKAKRQGQISSASSKKTWDEIKQERGLTAAPVQGPSLIQEKTETPFSKVTQKVNAESPHDKKLTTQEKRLAPEREANQRKGFGDFKIAEKSIKPSEPEPTAGDIIIDFITDPFGTLDRAARIADEAIARDVESNPVLNFTAKNLGAGVAQANRNTLGVLEAAGMPDTALPVIRRAADSSINAANEVNKDAGPVGQVAAQVIQTMPNALSQVALAVASRGASIPTQLGQNTILQGVNSLLTSPTFINSMLQSFGGAYNQAIDEGAAKPQAITKALMQALPESLIEQAGGLETISAKLANKTRGLIGTALTSAIEEGLEEIFQYPFEALAKKATYAPGTPIFSMDESAVINPVEMGQNALVGGLAGGFMGGGAKAISDIAVRANPRTEPAGDVTNQQDSVAIFETPVTSVQEQSTAGDIDPLMTVKTEEQTEIQEIKTKSDLQGVKGLRAYTEEETTQIPKEGKTYKNAVASSVSDLSTFFTKWKDTKKDKLEKLYLGKVSTEFAQKASKFGFDLRGYDFILTNDNVHHIYNEHGDPKIEAPRGQLVVDENTIKKLPAVLSSPDNIRKGYKDNNDAIVFEKNIGGQAIVVEAINTGRKTLETRTMYVVNKKENHTPAPEYANASKGSTSETAGPKFSTNIILQNIDNNQDVVNEMKNNKSELTPEAIKAITGNEDVIPDIKPVGAAIENTEDVSTQFQGETVPVLDLKSERGAITLPGKKEQRLASGYKGYSDQDMEVRHRENRLQPESLPQKIGNFFRELKLISTRTFPLIDPSLENNAVFMQEAVRFPKIRRMAGGEAVRILKDITLRENMKLNADDFNIFERVVFMRDLLEDDQLGLVLPNGWTSESLQAEWGNIQPYINENVQAALDRRKEHLDKVKGKYIKAFKSIGYDVSERFKRENYFRHQVLEYMQIKQAASSGAAPDHVAKNRGWSKSREGTNKNINTDYLQAEYEVLFGMLNDTQIAEMWRRIYNKYDIRAEVEAKADAEQKNWRQNIPEGYAIHQPFQGNYMFSATSIPQQILDDAVVKGLTEIGVPVDKVRQVMAVGAKRMEYVIPKEYITTMQKYYNEIQSKGVLDNASKYLMSQWKQTVLTRIPTKVFKYNFRNLSGDVDSAVRAFGFKTSAEAIGKSNKAAKELWEALRYHKFTPDLLRFRDLGGLDDNLFVQEIAMISRSKEFKELTGVRNRNFLKSWDEFSSDMTQYRENIVRYAVYSAVKDNLSKSPNELPNNYAASLPGRIKGLRNIEERAYQMTNDAIGNYAEVTVAGRWLRNHLFPFWSFKERNLVSFARVIKNVANEITESDGQKIAKGLGLTAKVTGKTAVVVGKTAVRLFGLSMALALMNMLNPNDDELPDDIRNSPHITLWKGADGQIRYFSRLGVMTDIMEWFGLDSLPADLKDLQEGKTNAEQIGMGMLKSPVNVIYSMLTPYIKTPIEIISGQSRYPDAFTPRAIRDGWQYAADTLGVGKEYKYIAGKPVREDYITSLQDAFLYRSDPEESAYYKSLDLKRQFQNQVLGEKSSTSFTPTERSNALYYYKLALKYKDEKAAKKYFKEYVRLVTEDAKRDMEVTGKPVDISKKIVEGISRSLDTLSPVYGLSENELAAYLNWLQPKDREAVKKGMEYFAKVMRSGQ